jgi:hypothetical protein
MKVILDIKDNKVDFILDILKQYSFVKAKPVKRSKEKLLEDIKEALEEVKLAEEGKIKLQSAEDFLNEL